MSGRRSIRVYFSQLSFIVEIPLPNNKFANLYSWPHFFIIISTNRPRRQSCLIFRCSQSATRIHRNTSLWLAVAENKENLTSSSISRYYKGGRKNLGGSQSNLTAEKYSKLKFLENRNFQFCRFSRTFLSWLSRIFWSWLFKNNINSAAPVTGIFASYYKTVSCMIWIQLKWS